MRTSTGEANAEESQWIEACKVGVCVACFVWEQSEDAPDDFLPIYGCDYHHTKSGNIRRGHLLGFGLCTWHHRGHPPEGHTSRSARIWFGPGLMDGSKRFNGAYGSDDDLIEVQHTILHGTWR